MSNFNDNNNNNYYCYYYHRNHCCLSKKILILIIIISLFLKDVQIITTISLQSCLVLNSYSLGATAFSFQSSFSSASSAQKVQKVDKIQHPVFLQLKNPQLYQTSPLLPIPLTKATTKIITMPKSLVIDKATSWIQNDPNELTSSYVNDLIQKVQREEEEEEEEEEEAFQQLQSLFPIDGSRIGFGTAGLRSAMKPGPLGMNDLVIIQATQGLAKYCLQQQQCREGDKSNKLIAVIGYDHRSNPHYNLSSKSFAILTKLVFLHAGFDDCILLDGFVPTPLVAYSTTKLGAVVGIMITASHNPKDDAGYKVYWNDGCQIRAPIDKGIADCIEQNLEPWTDYKVMLQKYLIDDSSTTTTTLSFDNCFGLSNPDITKLMADSYFEAIRTSGLITGQNKLYSSTSSSTTTTNPKPKIAYTAMHGVGHPWAVKSFEIFHLDQFHTVPQQRDANPNFPTVPFPNPEEKGALDISMKFAMENGCDIVLANDPDADRLAVAERCRQSGLWTVFTGDQIGVMLGHWIWESIGKHCKKPVAMCASTVSSKMLSAIAKTEGFLFVDTLTGFKNIGSKAIQLAKEGYRPLFLYEEAIGFCCGDVIYDKDGLTAAGVMSELALHLYQNGKSLAAHMQSLYDKYGEFCCNNGYYFIKDPSVTQRIMDNIRNGGEYMASVGGYEVKSTRDLGYPGYDSTTDDKKPTLPVSKSSPMITITFVNGCVVQLRASGTEPKFKYYIEMQGEIGVKRETVMEESTKCSKIILEELLKPNEFGLTEP